MIKERSKATNRARLLMMEAARPLSIDEARQLMMDTARLHTMDVARLLSIDAARPPSIDVARQVMMVLVLRQECLNFFFYNEDGCKSFYQYPCV